MAQERVEKAGLAVESVVCHGEFQLSLIEVSKRHEVTAASSKSGPRPGLAVGTTHDHQSVNSHHA